MKGPPPDLTWINGQGLLWGRVNLLDLLVGLFVVSMTPLFYYGYKNVVQYQELKIEKVDPEVVTAGVKRRISIMGSGFDGDSTVQIGDLLPQKGFFMNEARLDVEIPPDIGPGQQRVLIRNRRGRMVMQDEAFTVLIGNPKISQVEMQPAKDGKALLVISGNYFEKGCTATLDQFPLQDLAYKSAMHLEAKVPAYSIEPGQYTVTVTNPSGMRGKLEDALMVAWKPEIESVTPSKITVGEKRTLIVTGRYFQRECIVSLSLGSQILSSVNYVDPTHLEVRIPPYLVAPGVYHLYVTNRGGTEGVKSYAVEVVRPPKMKSSMAMVVVHFERLSNRDLQVLSELPEWRGLVWKSFNPRKLCTNVALTGEMDFSARRQRFFYRGQPLTVGSRVSFPIQGKTYEAVVASEPVPLVTTE